MKVMTFILGILFCSSIFAQTNRLESNIFIYWQPKTAIHFDDYKKVLDSIDLRKFEKYNAKSMANIQIHTILDCAKKAGQIKQLKEKWYLSPVFCKECSPLKEQDSTELQKAQLYFDIAEYCTRVTRKKITDLQNGKLVKDSNEFIAASFPGLVDNMYNLMIEMFSSYKREVIVQKKPNAHAEWRKTINELLDSLKDYPTSVKECLRFVNNKPVSEDYKVSYQVYGK